MRGYNGFLIAIASTIFIILLSLSVPGPKVHLKGVAKKAEPLSKTSRIANINPDFDSIKSHLKILSARIIPKIRRPNSCINCNNFNFTPIIHPHDVCSGNTTIELLVLITTIPEAVKGREALRNTWLQHSKNNTANIRHVFLFGGGWSKQEQAILYDESSQFGDILQENYKDAYYNLSLKVISGYKWALKFCNHAKFTLRTADDNYINIPEIVKWVNTKGPKNSHVQIGHRLANILVHRQRNKKWFVTPIEYPERVYPTYSMGTAFMFSMVAIKDIVKAAPNVPFFAIEDAWFGLLMREIKMGVVNEPGFDKLLEDKLLKQLMDGKCPDEGKFLSIHLVSAEAMQLLWNHCSSLLNGSKHLPKHSTISNNTPTTLLTPSQNNKTASHSVPNGNTAFTTPALNGKTASQYVPKRNRTLTTPLTTTPTPSN